MIVGVEQIVLHNVLPFSSGTNAVLSWRVGWGGSAKFEKPMSQELIAAAHPGKSAGYVVDPVCGQH